MASKSPEQMLTEIHDKVTRMETVILGVPDTDNRGLCGEVKNLRKDMNHFKRNFWVLVGVLTGSGVISVGVFQIIGG